MIKIKLRQLMWDNEVTAVALHNATGVSKSIISEIIHNKRVNIGLDIVNKFCIFFKCGVNDLLEFVEE
ncbi:helix-turn-helix transcriptional regulator [bacterium]|nr:helix-turn-helix transcriptional regulator [bacterium]